LQHKISATNPTSACALADFSICFVVQVCRGATQPNKETGIDGSTSFSANESDIFRKTFCVASLLELLLLQTTLKIKIYCVDYKKSVFPLNYN
jgi:hypothetical protein